MKATHATGRMHRLRPNYMPVVPLTPDEIARRYGLIASVVGHRDPSPENWAVLCRILAGASDEELITTHRPAVSDWMLATERAL